jgi:hypothetical protein
MVYKQMQTHCHEAAVVSPTMQHIDRIWKNIFPLDADRDPAMLKRLPGM